MSYVSTCLTGADTHTHTHTLYEKHTHVHGQSHMPDIPQDRSHENMSHSNRWPLTIDQRPPSHTFQTHTLALPRDSADLRPGVKGVVVWWCGLILCVWSHFLPESLRRAKVAAWVDLKMGAQWGGLDMTPRGNTILCEERMYVWCCRHLAPFFHRGQTPNILLLDFARNTGGRYVIVQNMDFSLCWFFFFFL